MSVWSDKLKAISEKIDRIEDRVIEERVKHYSLVKVYEGSKIIIGFRLLYEEAVLLSKIANKKIKRLIQQSNGESMFEITQLEIQEEV